MGEFGVGQPVPREEDPYLLRGVGREAIQHRDQLGMPRSPAADLFLELSLAAYSGSDRAFETGNRLGRGFVPGKHAALFERAAQHDDPDALVRATREAGRAQSYLVRAMLVIRR